MILKFAIASFLVSAFASATIDGQTDPLDTNEGQDPPNIHLLTRSVNALLGKPPFEQREQGFGLFDLTPEEKTGDYNTFKELFSPNFQAECEHKVEARGNYWATSASSLESFQYSHSKGFDGSVDLGVTVPYKDIDFTPEVAMRTALVFGNSKSSSTSFKESKVGFTHSRSTNSASALYSYKVDYAKIASSMTWTERFINECQNLGTNPNNHALLEFFQKVGTHGLKFAVFGKQCTGSVFMEGERSDEEYESFFDETSNYDVAFLWFNAKGSSNERDEQNEISTQGFNIKFTNMRCVGDVAKDTSCGGGMIGNGEDRPAIIQWSFKPIWEMDVPGFSESAKEKMKSLVEEFVAASTRCSVTHCNGRGACAVSDSKWNNLPTSIDLDTFFDTDRCFCFTTHETIAEGKHCDQAPKPSSHLTVSGWTNWLNNYDKDMKYDGKFEGKQGAISGMESEHNNRREDRRFKMMTKVPNGNPEVHVVPFGSNKWNERLLDKCAPNSVLTSLTSYHNNRREDRNTVGLCGKFEGWETDECYWTEWQNDFDEEFTFECPGNYVFAGMESYHQNRQEDRRHKFYICKFKRAKPPPLPPGDIKKKESETSVY